MKEKLESKIWHIFAKYNMCSGYDNKMRMENVLNYCMSDLQNNPMLEQKLFVIDAWDFYVMQSILKCVSRI